MVVIIIPILTNSVIFLVYDSYLKKHYKKLDKEQKNYYEQFFIEDLDNSENNEINSINKNENIKNNLSKNETKKENSSIPIKSNIISNIEDVEFIQENKNNQLNEQLLDQNEDHQLNSNQINYQNLKNKEMEECSSQNPIKLSVSESDNLNKNQDN